VAVHLITWFSETARELRDEGVRRVFGLSTSQSIEYQREARDPSAPPFEMLSDAE